MRFIELFAGIGGLRYGLEKANDRNCDKGKIRKGKARLQPDRNGNRNEGGFANIGSGLQPVNNGYFRCIYANEWDKYACQIYRKNYGEGELYEGDITKVSAESIPDFDMLVAGFPCPSYSFAGKRKGFADSRGALYFEIPRIAKVKRPRLLLLENVKGLLNHDQGDSFRTILLSLSELGYDCEWEVLNSKNFGVPQNRERVFIIGHLRGTGGGKVFPIGGTVRKGDESSKRQTSGCIKGVSGHIQNDDTYIIQALDANYAKGNASFAGSKRAVAFTSNRIRRLTPIECERLQGFPDGWTEGVSDTQRYKCLGNAVTTNVITEIGKRILR